MTLKAVLLAANGITVGLLLGDNVDNADGTTAQFNVGSAVGAR